jgi:hypothetical protein
MKARLVDERDTQWETDLLDLRVFIIGEGGAVSAYDLDSVRFEDAKRWAETAADSDAQISIALRRVDVDGHPGLIWIQGG